MAASQSSAGARPAPIPCQLEVLDHPVGGVVGVKEHHGDIRICIGLAAGPWAGKALVSVVLDLDAAIDLALRLVGHIARLRGPGAAAMNRSEEGHTVMKRIVKAALAATILVGLAEAGAAGPKTMPGCRYEYGGLSVEHMAQDGSPVLFQWFDCSGRLTKRYIDFTGRELAKGSLVPNERYRMIDYLEELLGVDIAPPEIDDLEDLAIARGLI